MRKTIEIGIEGIEEPLYLSGDNVGTRNLDEITMIIYANSDKENITVMIPKFKLLYTKMIEPRA